MPGLGQAVLAGMELPDVARQGAEMRPPIVAAGAQRELLHHPLWAGAERARLSGKGLWGKLGSQRVASWTGSWVGGALCSVQTPLSLAFSSVPCSDVMGFPPQPPAGFLTVPALSQALLALTQPTRTAQRSSFCLQVFVVFFFNFSCLWWNIHMEGCLCHIHKDEK